MVLKEWLQMFFIYWCLLRKASEEDALEEEISSERYSQNSYLIEMEEKK